MRLTHAFALPLAVVLAMGCYRRTELAATWHEPNVGRIHFQRPVAIMVSTDDGFRRSVEDELAGHFPNAVPGYRVIPSADGVDKQSALARLRDAGFDGAIMMRVVDVSKELNYTPGTYWGDRYGFAGYWGNAWAYPYSPGYVTTSTIVSVETQIYSLTEDRLLYAARSETTDPANAGKLIRSIMRHIDEDLRKNSMIASSPAVRTDMAMVAAGF